jgi:hypothetical protein
MGKFLDLFTKCVVNENHLVHTYNEDKSYHGVGVKFWLPYMENGKPESIICPLRPVSEMGDLEDRAREILLAATADTNRYADESNIILTDDEQHLVNDFVYNDLGGKDWLKPGDVGIHVDSLAGLFYVVYEPTDLVGFAVINSSDLSLTLKEHNNG